MNATSAVAPADAGSNANARVLLVGALAAGAAAAALFLTFPTIDLAVARALYAPELEASAPRATILSGVRYAILYAFWAAAAAAVALTAVAVLKRTALLGLDGRRWGFICLCLVVGPGLVANTLLKDNWGRARPKQVIELGGTKAFSPPLLPTNQCERNCSFVSGEASALFAPFYAAALVAPQGSALLIAAGTIAGLLAGLIRMSQGAHFLSDVLFAGIFMAITAALLHRVLFGWRAAPWRMRPSPAPQAPAA